MLLLMLMVLTSFAEIFSIGAVLPFLGVLTSPYTVYNQPFLQPLFSYFGIASPEELLLPVTAGFMSAALLAGGMRLFQLWSNTQLSFATGADLSIELYRRTLFQPYSVHVARNSSEIINAVATKVTSVIYNVITPFVTLISSSVILVAIIVTLVFINPVIAFFTFSGFGLAYALIIVLTRKRLKLNSQKIAQESNQVVKSLQEGLGGIRDVLIDENQAVYVAEYSRAVKPLRQAQGNNVFIDQSPRFGIEAIGMVLIALLAYSLTHQSGGVTKAIPVLGTLVLGAQRLLPILQQVYASLSRIQGENASFRDVLALLEQPLPKQFKAENQNGFSFTRQMELTRLSFRYTSETAFVLRNFNLGIKKGSRIGFIGATGSGKSTLLDIIMGLLEPTEGNVCVDGQPVTEENRGAWQQHIAHVPQSIFLSDATVEENIAFGVPKEKIDHERVKLAAHQAQIADIIESWTQKYKTIVGERGVRLSGGQRQRIGIARALYKQADLIIFDEATSALDSETEAAVMQAIEDLSQDLTLLIIAHRLTTLKNCTHIVELGGGGIKRSGSYQDIVNQAATTP
jgi:ATP-binding cassette, subfamily B, bacterial PglK